MKMKQALAALPLVLSLALSMAAQARTDHRIVTPTYPSGGREVAAPAGSFACTTDQGPRECGEPMWVYGNPDTLSRFKSAF
jgi:hypothetical protein